MLRSTDRILTTHVGSLPAPPALDPNAPGYEDWLRSSVAGVLERQRAAGLDILNEGEYTKGGDWLAFADHRFGGFEPRSNADERPLFQTGLDRQTFSDFYDYATEKRILFYSPGEQMSQRRPKWVCTNPITYSGQKSLEREIRILKEAAGDASELFLTSTAPGSLEPYRANEFYASEEEFVFAMADAMREEYETIAGAGILLQVDDAWLPALWDRIGIQMGLEAFRRRCQIRCDALNSALRNIPEERIRYHICWGSWHGPHAFDLELKHIVDIMLGVKAQAYLIEGGNARHEHEYVVWDDAKLPEGKILIPGVVSHATEVIEHPELVSQRIQRFAQRLGRENVIASTDCGFGGRSHPQIAWAKLKSLAEGAQRASKALWA